MLVKAAIGILFIFRSHSDKHLGIPKRMNPLLLIKADWRIYALIKYTSLVQIMTCRQVSTKPLSEPKLEYY